MHPSTLFPDLERPEAVADHQPAYRGPAAPGCLLIASVAVTVAILAGVADLLAPEPYIPPAVRGLLNTLALLAWANWFGRRAEARADRRMDALEAKVETRLRSASNAEAFVDGLARRPWDPDRYSS